MEITTEENRISIDGVSYPKGGFYVKPISKGVRLVAMSRPWSIKILVDGTTIDGSPVADRDELMTFFNEQGFKSGGTGPIENGVQSVTGAGVDNTDPKNPVISRPNWNTIEGKPDFVAEGANAAAARAALGLGTAATTDSSASAVNDSLVVRTSAGQGKFAPAVNADEAVVLSQHQADLELKVDKVAGKVLSDTNFTADEKSKLAGLEDVHYKGWHPSLSALQAKYPTADEGSHAFVDDVSGSVAYIWDVSENSWVIRAGESTELTPAQTKVLYESNPDTNAFTDDFKSKLESITSIFTTALKTAYDSAVSWISVNGANLLNHLSDKSNPHNVTAAQLGIVGVENIGKAWIPDYSNMETTNRITSTGGSWTSDRRGFVYVLSRGYNSGIYHTQVAFINDKEVGKVWVEAVSSGTARSGSFSNIYPVKPGDVIKLYGNLEVKCLFIPGIWV